MLAKLAARSLVVLLVIGGAVYADEAHPSQPAPSLTPPAPPPSPPPPAAQPLEAPPAPPPAAAPAPVSPPPGQWVHTSQYGWLWMPYDRAYTYVATDGSVADMYVYYPAFGWRWVVAPWVIGFGPMPFWGALGPIRFAWYAHPWFRVGVPYRGWGPHFYGRGHVGGHYHGRGHR